MGTCSGAKCPTGAIEESLTPARPNERQPATHRSRPAALRDDPPVSPVVHNVQPLHRVGLKGLAQASAERPGGVDDAVAAAQQ
jgi:hypothetical protein